MKKQRVTVIAIKQPQASLIAHGKIKFTTFPFQKNIRGLVCIYASNINDRLNHHEIRKDFLYDMLGDIGYRNRSLPHDCIVGFAHLAGMLSTQKMRSRLERHNATAELAMSDWSDGRWAWLFTQQRALRTYRYLERPSNQTIWSPEINAHLIYKNTY